MSVDCNMQTFHQTQQCPHSIEPVQIRCHDKFCFRVKHFNEFIVYSIHRHIKDVFRNITLNPVTIFIYYCLCSPYFICIYLLTTLFSLYLKGRIFHLLVHSPKSSLPPGLEGQALARSQELIWVSYMGNRNPST